MRKKIVMLLTNALLATSTYAQLNSFSSATASVNPADAPLAIDNKIATGWKLSGPDLQQDQLLSLTLNNPGDLKALQLKTSGISKADLPRFLQVYITYDPMNPGEAVPYQYTSEDQKLTFKTKYGAYVRLVLKGRILSNPVTIREVTVIADLKDPGSKPSGTKDKPWMNAGLPVSERVELLLAVMTPEQKMDLLREGWGIPGIPALSIPFVSKVEAIHGYSYGSGATIFPQSIGLGATWDKKLVEAVSGAIGEETASAHTMQAWSPVLDVAQDPRWGRCEETYGEDPILVSEIGGAWIKGFQSKGLITTPKHFAGHGAPLGGRDSHDIGLSEREMREIHLVPFRNAVEKYHCQSIMENYSDYLGVPVAKSRELLQGILREEWGFDGFVVSDCGALRNLMDVKHYTAENVVAAANEALAAGICTNCGDTYRNPDVIAAAKNGAINMKNLNFVCRTLLSTMFRNGWFDQKPSEKLDWNKIYPGWNSPEHREVARQAARESIVLLQNSDNLLPLGNRFKTIAVIGPGADDLQPGDYTAKLKPNQLTSVLTGIKSAAGPATRILYEKGCEFSGKASYNPQQALTAAQQADVVVIVLGDCSTSEADRSVIKTSGEGNDYSSLILPGYQQRLLEDLCNTGKPVILILQSGRPYNLSYAAEHCKAILVNWLPGQEGGPATADILFGNYNPGGRLPMTFPRSAGQLPLYYNFKTSGRGYNYVDMPFYPLFPFGFGLSYTHFNYSDLRTSITGEGNVTVQVKVSNTGKIKGDEVVQLYLTDMFASVKTRVMELKDFDRITLNAGESRELSFVLTPYQLSLLNENMERVVEPGTFKVSVGGRSPEYTAGDRIKNSVGYKSSENGVSTTFTYLKACKAAFELKAIGTRINPFTKVKEYLISVKNTGNLTDVGQIRMYADDVTTPDVHHFEVAPGAQKTIAFELEKVKPKATLLFVTNKKALTVKQ